MQAGKLRHLVTILQTIEGANNGYDSSSAESDWKRVPCSIEPLKGRELFNARQVQPDVTHKVGMRFLAGLTPKHRIKYERGGVTRFFDILAVMNVDERFREHQLMCKEVA